MAEESFRVKFEADVSGLKQGLQDLTRTAEDTSKAISPDAPNGLGKAAEAAADSLDGQNGSLGQSADKAAEALSGGESLEQAADKAADAIENAGKKSDTTAGNVENVGQKAAKAGESFGKAQSAAGNLTGELNKLGATGIPVVDRLIEATKRFAAGGAGMATAAVSAIGVVIAGIRKAWEEAKRIREEMKALEERNTQTEGAKSQTGITIIDQLKALNEDESPAASRKRAWLAGMLNSQYGDNLVSVGPDGRIGNLEAATVRLYNEQRKAALAPYEKAVRDAQKALFDQTGAWDLNDSPNKWTQLFGMGNYRLLRAELEAAQNELSQKQFELDAAAPTGDLFDRAAAGIDDSFDELPYYATDADRKKYARLIRSYRQAMGDGNSIDSLASEYRGAAPGEQEALLRRAARLSDLSQQINEMFGRITGAGYVPDAGDGYPSGTDDGLPAGTVRYIDRFGDGQMGHDIHDMAASMRSGRVLFVNNQGGY